MKLSNKNDDDADNDNDQDHDGIETHPTDLSWRPFKALKKLAATQQKF